MGRAPQGVALRVVGEGFLIARGILARFAEGELEMQPVVVREVAARERRAQCNDLDLAEAEGLEVGEAPVRLAERRLERNRAPVCADAFVLAAGGLERVSEAHP